MICPRERRSDGVIELVCFDMGRVLIRLCNNWREACGVAGITIPRTISR